jgi:glycosyltransferase involved in cell wall biosynthesis
LGIDSLPSLLAMNVALTADASAPAAPRAGGVPESTPTPLTVGIVADMLEESWPSMDLMADVLMRKLPCQAAWPVVPRLVRPPLVPVIRRVRRGRDGGGRTADRVFNRFWLYRRALIGLWKRCDVFHVVDHSYAHLVLTLPRARTIVTCHDTDTFRGFITPGPIETGLPRFLVRRLATGLQEAALVVCPSHATATSVVDAALAVSDRVMVVPNGVDHAPSDAAAERDAGRLLRSDPPTTDILHVGSTIPRKRLDLLLEAFAGVARRRTDARLVRVGGPFTSEQEAHARHLGVANRILALPFLSRGTLDAVYRRAALLVLPSDREGFGLPVVEAMAAGVPVVGRDLGVLREIAGGAATFVSGDDPDEWARAILLLLGEQRDSPVAWAARCDRARSRAAVFSWDRHAEAMARLYHMVARRGSTAPLDAEAGG